MDICQEAGVNLTYSDLIHIHLTNEKVFKFGYYITYVIFKICIGRIYDTGTKCWMFPNKCYKFLFDSLNTENDGHYLIESYHLIESEFNKVQVVIAKEDSDHFYVKIPFNMTLIDYFREMNGFFQTESNLCCFQQTSRQEFEDSMKDKK
jgi:hypothetical protein